jgi:succinate dehydrogenase/fumarate reductase flavoprotein subunit
MSLEARSAGVLVAGGGMAGLCAALSAREAGAEVTVLEKADVIGGSARLSGGVIFTFPTLELQRQRIPEGDESLQRLLAGEFAESLGWLEHHGVPLGPAQRLLGDGWGRVMEAGSPGRRGAFMERLRARAEAMGVGVLTRRALSSVEPSFSGPVMVGVESEAGPEMWQASSLILATGGYQANRELLSRFLGPASDFLMIRTCPACTGDGFLAGLAAGASVSRGLGTFYGHTMPAASIPPEEWQTITPYFASVGVLVNRYGLRFTDESIGTIEEANAWAGMQQPDGRYYLIFDQRIYREHVTGPGVLGGVLPAPNKFERAKELGAPVLEAPGLEGLIRAMEEKWGVNGSRLSDELDAYNRAVVEGRGATLIPPRTRFQQPLSEGPYYAMTCIPAITFPYGGLLVDGDCQVLNRTGTQIPGLYAAGVDAGGVFNRIYAGGLAWALVSGRAAGRNAARSALRRE